MARPVIGITVSKYNPPAAEGVAQVSRLALPVNYAEAVIDAGGVPMTLPRSEDFEVVASALARIDGLMLSGGGDVNALAFGEEPHPKCALVDAVRDGMEIEAIGLALERGIPVLGICRGIQVLNVACGGTLLQDIPSEVHRAVQHATIQSEPGLCHMIEIEAGCLLARLFGKTRIAVNSTHHQAIKDLGRGLRVTARAADGVIEAVESDEGGPILGVQCHPERNYREYPEFAALFRWLVDEAAKHRAGGM